MPDDNVNRSHVDMFIETIYRYLITIIIIIIIIVIIIMNVFLFIRITVTKIIIITIFVVISNQQLSLSLYNYLLFHHKIIIYELYISLSVCVIHITVSFALIGLK